MPSQKRLPTSSDFPSNLIISIVSPPSNQAPVNILILLHGLGDTHLPYAKLGSQFNLPNTACLAIKAPNILPFEETSFHWCDDVIFDSSTNGLDPDGGFKTATKMLNTDIVQKSLVEKCGYAHRDIVLFGLGQGGMAALNATLLSGKEFGGVVSIGGALPAEASASSSPRNKTPILICSGVDSQYINDSAEEKLRKNFDAVQISRYKRRGDNMPQNRDEMRPVMQFFAQRLRQAAPMGTTEIS